MDTHTTVQALKAVMGLLQYEYDRRYGIERIGLEIALRVVSDCLAVANQRFEAELEDMERACG